MSKNSLNRHHPDALVPSEIAIRSEAIAEQKAKMDAISTFVLALLAGAFIAWGGAFYTVTITHGSTDFSYGVVRLLGGLAFSLGLILVVVGGAELFTGNNLIVMAWASRRISTRQVLRNWTIVYLGNLFGAVSTALLISQSGFSDQSSGAVGETMIQIGVAKCQLNWIHAVAAGIGCNLMVCLAIWLCMSARSVVDKVVAIIFPITAFVATGMEHCVANMYFIPAAMLVDSANTPSLTIANMLWRNLLPVTIGNLIGGAILVGMVYWFVYLRTRPHEKQNIKEQH